MTYLTIIGMLALVLSPVLLAAAITAAHAVRGTNRPYATVRQLRPTAA